jgi:hypothetical protein
MLWTEFFYVYDHFHLIVSYDQWMMIIAITVSFLHLFRCTVKDLTLHKQLASFHMS